MNDTAAHLVDTLHMPFKVPSRPLHNNPLPDLETYLKNRTRVRGFSFGGALMGGLAFVGIRLYQLHSWQYGIGFVLGPVLGMDIDINLFLFRLLLGAMVCAFIGYKIGANLERKTRPRPIA